MRDIESNTGYEVCGAHMKYKQIAVARLGKAARRLRADGSWHVFENESETYYRVVRRVMQQVQFESGEEKSLLDLFEHFEPLPARALKEGFREPLCIRVEDDRYTLEHLYLRAFTGWETLARAASGFGVEVYLEAKNMLACRASFDEWSREAVLEKILVMRAIAVAASQLQEDSGSGVRYETDEVVRLIHTANTVLHETLHASGKRRRVSGRSDLGNDSRDAG